MTRPRIALLCTFVLSVSLAALVLNAPIAPVAGAPSDAVVGGLDLTVCTCSCVGPVWELQEVETSGSCQALVGQACWSRFGPGTFFSCSLGGLPE